MKIKFSSFSLLIAVSCTSLHAGIYDNSPETVFPQLKGILKQAEEHSHTYEKLDISLKNATLNKEINLSSRRPSVYFGTGAGASWTNAKDNKGETHGIQAGVNDLNLSTGYQLYNWGAKQANFRSAEKYYENFLINYEKQMASIGRSIRGTYLQLILDKFKLKTLELEIQITQSNIDQDSVRHEEGRLSNENYLRAMNSRKLRLIDIEQEKRGIRDRIQDFNKLVGIDILTFDQIPSSIPKVKNSNEEIIALGRQSESRKFTDLPSVRVAQNNLDIAENNIISAESRTKPRVNLSGGLTYDIEPTKGNELVLVSRAGLSIGWEIYSGGANTKRILKSYNDRSSQMADYMDLLKQTKIDLDRSIENLQYRYSRLEISESEYQLALQNYEKSKDEYSRGRMSDINFQRVELSRLHQEYAIYQARKDYMIASTDFLSTMGKDPVLQILTPPEKKDLSDK